MRRRKKEWEKEERKARKAREEAKEHLKKQGQLVEKSILEQGSEAVRNDNTLELLEERQKAEAALLLANKSEETETETNKTQSEEQSVINQQVVDLPQGWEIVDIEDYCVFRHTSSGCCTLQKPQKQKSDAKDASQKEGLTMPLGWKVLQDPSSNKFYFWNATLNTTSWEIPSPPIIESVNITTNTTTITTPENDNNNTLEVTQDSDNTTNTAAAGTTKVEVKSNGTIGFKGFKLSKKKKRKL